MSVFGIGIGLSAPCPAIRDIRETIAEEFYELLIYIGKMTILINKNHPKRGIVREGF